MVEGKHGVSANTPGRTMLGAGTIHKGLKYTPGASGQAGKWNFKESLVGATSGGSSYEIKPELYTLPADGALVRVKGLDVKNGGTASLTVNLMELTPEVLMAATLGMEGTSDVTGYTMIQDKPDIQEDDYWDNIAFVGKTAAGKRVIAIFENAVCTSGMSSEGKNKEASVGSYTFECSADMEGDLDTLPWKIYYPDDL